MTRELELLQYGQLVARKRMISTTATYSGVTGEEDWTVD